MPSARELARTYVAQAWTNATPVSAADAASDVWEPIVAELVRTVEGLADQQAMPDSRYEAPLARAREALGIQPPAAPGAAFVVARWVPFLALLEQWRRHGFGLDPDATSSSRWVLSCGCVLGWEDRARPFPDRWRCPKHGVQERVAGLVQLPS